MSAWVVLLPIVAVIAAGFRFTHITAGLKGISQTFFIVSLVIFLGVLAVGGLLGTTT